MPNSTIEWIIFIIVCMVCVYVIFEIIRMQIKHNKEMSKITDKQLGLNKEETKYWVEKITQRDGKTRYSIESNEFLLPSQIGGKYFDTRQEAIDRIILMLKRKHDSEIVSKEVVYSSGSVDFSEDPHIKQGEEPKGSVVPLSVGERYSDLKGYEFLNSIGHISNDDLLEIQKEYELNKIGNPPLSPPIDPRTLEYLAHLDKKMENSDFFKQEAKRLEEIKNNLKPERDWFESGGNHLS